MGIITPAMRMSLLCRQVDARPSASLRSAGRQAVAIPFELVLAMRVAP